MKIIIISSSSGGSSSSSSSSSSSPTVKCLQWGQLTFSMCTHSQEIRNIDTDIPDRIFSRLINFIPCPQDPCAYLINIQL